MNSKILIIDDEKDICYLISEILQDEKFITESVSNSSEAIKKLETFRPDLIILDVWLGPNSELDGIELLKKIMTINSMIPVIVITGHGTVDMAVNAIKNGAYDFIEKPFSSEKIMILSKRAIESAKLSNENKLLKKIAHPNTPLIGNSSFIINLKKDLDRFSKSKSRILITGSRGSGKKLIAQIIHKKLFGSENLVKIIDFKNLSDSELSEILDDNQEKTTNKNIFINSSNGTLVFDNIDSLPIFFQKKILFYLENENFLNKYNIKRKIKIISISSKNFDYEIQQGILLKICLID